MQHLSEVQLQADRLNGADSQPRILRDTATSCASSKETKPP